MNSLFIISYLYKKFLNLIRGKWLVKEIFNFFEKLSFEGLKIFVW